MHVSFESFLERANRARTTEELVTEFLETVKQHGLDRMVFCLETKHHGIDLEPGFGVLQNYPEDWMNYYREKGFARLDPVTLYCKQKKDTFTWAEIPRRMDMSALQFKCLNLGIEAGLHNGICLPLFGPGQFAGIGLASREKRDSFDGKTDLITAYANHFYIAFQRIHRRKDYKLPNIGLSYREMEILKWASEGKSKTDIGDILKISDNTVDSHLRRIYKKLDAPNRVVATTKAVSYGLIRS